MAETRTTSSTGGQKGVKLARFDLIPTGPLKALAEHYGRGAAKYANHQWRQGYEWSKSYAAMTRHQNAFWGGEDYDVCPADEDGCAFVTNEGEEFPAFWTEHGRGCYNHTTSHHLAAVAWHAFCLLEFVEAHPDHDDRYKPPAPANLVENPAFEAASFRRVEWGQPALPTEEAKAQARDQARMILRDSPVPTEDLRM